MRALYALLAAVMLGLAGGYAWSAMQPSGKPAHVRKAVFPHIHDAPETDSDREWAARANAEATPEIEGNRSDPTEVEQSAYYAGCNGVRAAGKAPLRVGEPGYRSEMDGDGDGIACEPYHGN